MRKINHEGVNFYTDEISAKDTNTFRGCNYSGHQRKIEKLEPELVLDKFVKLFITLGEVVGIDEKSWSLPIRGVPDVQQDFKMAQWYCRNALAEEMVDEPLLRKRQYENELIIFPSEYALRLMFDEQK